ncbi:MAG: RHS repeat-associated core domain-containing protein, partial [Chloroflexota bacterium]
AAGEWSDTSASLSAGPTGLLYLRARYYAPQWGQFLTRDPFPGLLTHPATQAPYPYALNNPLRYTDPSGEFVETLFDLAMVGNCSQRSNPSWLNADRNPCAALLLTDIIKIRHPLPALPPCALSSPG